MKSKKKISSKQGMALGCDYSPTVYIDFDDLKEVSGVSVGDKVSVVLRGTVRSVDMREGEAGKVTSSVSLKDFEAEIVDDSNALASLLDDEDD